MTSDEQVSLRGTHREVMEARPCTSAQLLYGIPVWGDSIDGPSLLSASLAGLGRLRAMRAHVNALNVFPVPDGDTGTNMVQTMQGACGRARANGAASAASVAADLAQGALLGARGNSGVILSQLLRGFSLALEGCEVVRAEEFAQALEKAAETAYRSVARPVEGTILTVASDAAAEARAAVGQGVRSIVDLLARVVLAAERSVQRTPDSLAMLKQAGVVDSGGAGLFYLLQGMLRSAYGEKLEDEDPKSPNHAHSAMPACSLPDDGQDWEVVVDVIFREGAGMDDLRSLFDPIGTSLQIGEGDGICRAHLHVSDGRQYQAIDGVRGLGTLLRASLENLRAQVAAVTGMGWTAWPSIEVEVLKDGQSRRSPGLGTEA